MALKHRTTEDTARMSLTEDQELFRELFGDSDDEGGIDHHTYEASTAGLKLTEICKTISVRETILDRGHVEEMSIPGLVVHRDLIPPWLSQMLFEYFESTYFADTQLVTDKVGSAEGPRINQGMYFGRFSEDSPFFLLERICRAHPALLPPSVLARGGQGSQESLFDQAIINLYDNGEGISDHVDLMRFDNAVVGFSFGGSCEMRFRPATRADKLKASGVHSASKTPYSDITGTVSSTQGRETSEAAAGASEPKAPTYHRIRINAGDVYAMSGEARYEWTHGISGSCTASASTRPSAAHPRRISVTLRKLLGGLNP
ncbi:hypothetical protein EV182_000324 [Spiromyces aspiralis]|uniref:Uncharacterized protein n=1 Tax=Spiromyces aspiralis TaxID=68401 RepID=A0ACC1HV03_9FUNG|nr:hypothetical protein EV182_000324 [Spiromyces aspiralis]